MWRYVKAALLVRPRVGPLGAVPLNGLLAVAFGVLGAVQPAFWLAGAGVITLIVFALATSERFRRLVDAEDLAGRGDETERRRRDLIASLDPGSRQRLAELQARGAQVMEAHRVAGADPVVAQSSRDALDRLEWIHLKLLIARRTMVAEDPAAVERQIGEEIRQIERELGSDKLGPTVAESRRATLELLKKRLANAEHRRTSLAEIEADLERIETQVDLAVDDARLRGKPAAIGTNIQLASQMLDGNLYGPSSATIFDLDQSLGVPGPGRGGLGEAERPEGAR